MADRDRVIVVGGGDSAMEEANFLTRFASEVTLIHRSEAFRASKIMLERAKANPKIKFLLNTVVDDVFDVTQKLVTGVKLRDVKSGKAWEQEVDGFFLAIGHIPNTKPFVGQLDLDADGYIVSHGGARTNITGVFHAGDVQDRVYRQAITASGAGANARKAIGIVSATGMLSSTLLAVAFVPCFFVVMQRFEESLASRKKVQVAQGGA